MSIQLQVTELMTTRPRRKTATRWLLIEDPFGDDFSDLKLRKRFLTPLIEDFKTYGKALEKDGSKSDRAQLLALESENPIANLGDSAEGDGETERGTEVLH
jgi:hypothetical protein